VLLAGGVHEPAAVLPVATRILSRTGSTSGFRTVHGRIHGVHPGVNAGVGVDTGPAVVRRTVLRQFQGGSPDRIPYRIQDPTWAR